MRIHRVIAAVVLAIVAGSAAAPAQSQSGDAKPFTGGILAGVNLSKVAGRDVSNTKTRTGFIGGLFGVYHVYQGFGIEMDALYAQKGVDFGATEGASGSLDQDYIEVPLLARFDFATSSSVKPFVALGPSFGFSVRCHVTGTSEGVTASESCSDAGFDENKFDFGGTVGAGVGFPAGATTISVGVRYTYGFTDIEKNSDAKNRVWSFLAGFSW